jgi:hypothetical protein
MTPGLIGSLSSWAFVSFTIWGPLYLGADPSVSRGARAPLDFEK